MSTLSVSMSLEKVDEYEADIRRRNLLHLKREHSRLFDASSIAKRFRLTDRRTSRENASCSREKETPPDRLDGLIDYEGLQVARENQARRLELSSRVENNQDTCTSAEMICADNEGLENNFHSTHSGKTLKFKLLDALRQCSLVTKADHAGSGPSEVPFSGGIDREVQDDGLKDVGGRLESPAVQSPIVHCISSDDDVDVDGASDDIGHLCQVETPAISIVHRQGRDDHPLKTCHIVTSQLFPCQDSPQTVVGSGPLEVSFSGDVEGEVQDDALKDDGGRLESPTVQSPIVRYMSDDDADGASDGIEHTCQVETPSNSNVHRQGRDDRPLKMCHTVTSQLFLGQDSPGTGDQVDANLDVQFCEDGAENLGNDTSGDNDRVEILSDSNYAGRHLSEKDKHPSSNQGQSVEESMVEKQPVPTIVDHCTTNYDGIETVSRESFQSPVKHYSMRPWSSEKKKQYSSPQPVGHYSMRPRCSEKKKQYSSPQPVRLYSMRPRCNEKKKQYSSPQPVRHYSMRPRCSEKKKQCSSPRTLGGRRKLQWTLEEVKILEEGVQKLSSTDDKSMPWKEILKYGSDVFKSRTTVDLKDKWRNICKGKSKLG